MSQILKPKKGYKLVKRLFGKDVEIPEEWKYHKLEEIGAIIGGGTPDSFNKEYWNGKILWAVPTDITKLQTNQIEDTKRKITKQGLEDSSAKLLPEGTILITSRATIGKCAITTKPICTNQGFQNIICNNDYHNLFIFYSMKHNRNRLLRLSYGTTFLEISKSEIRKVSIPIPNFILEQQKIASILSNVDNLIINTQKIINQTKSVKKGLMQKLLTKGIGHKKFKKVKFGLRFIVKEIPEEWSVKRIDIVCKSIVSGRNKPKNFDGDIPWITIEDLDNFFIKKSKLNLQVSKIEIKQSGGKIIPKNSVIMSCVGEFGIIGINENEVVLNQQLHAFQCLNYITPYFLALFLSTMKNYMDSVSTMTTISYLNKNNCGSILIVIPPLSEQQQISSIISTIDSQIQSQTQYKEKLEKLKKSLMQKLLTGQVRVSV